jgi:hypothetical protein
MVRNWIRKIIGGLSFTSVMFIFQACYGTPQDFGLDLLIEGQVKSKTSGLPVKGVKVSVANNIQYEFTDAEGRFSFYTEILENLTVKFQDVDGDQNGLFADKDTIIANNQKKVYLNVLLVAK